MNAYVKSIAAAVALAVAAPAFADQLTANAGLSPAEAQGLSLTAIAQAKFNRDSRGDDRHEIVVPVAPSGDYGQLAASAGVPAAEADGMSLGEIFVAKINRESRGQDQQLTKSGSVTMASRSPSRATDRSQLIAAAGLSAADAQGMSLTEIAAAKFQRDTATGDR
jgi:hypothetical protein